MTSGMAEPLGSFLAKGFLPVGILVPQPLAVADFIHERHVVSGCGLRAQARSLTHNVFAKPDATAQAVVGAPAADS